MAVWSATAAWIGAWLGGWSPWPMLPGLVALLAVSLSGRRLAVFVIAVGMAAAVSGWSASGRASSTLGAELPVGPVTVAVRVLTDPIEQWGKDVVTVRPSHLLGGGDWVQWDGPRLRMAADHLESTAGNRLVVVGSVVERPGLVRGDPVAGDLVPRRIEQIGGPSDPLFQAGNLIRARVQEGIVPFAERPAATLLAGFLIGDVEALPQSDVDALRRTGLTHFVAVSGSNVALFLAAWWVAMGPLGWSPRRRAALGVVGLVLFVVVTRWEPSVVRAATMAGLVLGGVFFGVPVGAWTALGGAVSILLLVSGDLAGDVGFQLSIAATAGVLLGAGVWSHRRPRWMWVALGATASAQLAVAPLLLIHFGSVPLLAPVANLVAAPLVALSTALGGIGVILGVRPLTGVGVAAADLVLAVARAGRDLPQLGWDGVLGVAGAGLAALRRSLRPAIAVAAAGLLAVSMVLPGLPPSGPEMIVLDVGQGDAILFRDPTGAVVLFDGGPDPDVLRRALTSRNIARIDLLVVTHEHADHTTGLVGIGEYAAVRRVWVTPHAETAGPIGDLLAEMETAGTPIESPGPGWRASVGSFSFEVLGPFRRYASPNDGSLVVLVTTNAMTVLMAGDIEAIAQREIGRVPADVLKVPHQGAATSDEDWLAEVGATTAVISVGVNDYGHPSETVVAVLEEGGASVLRTDRDGDVVVRLDGL